MGSSPWPRIRSVTTQNPTSTDTGNYSYIPLPTIPTLPSNPSFQPFHLDTLRVRPRHSTTPRAFPRLRGLLPDQSSELHHPAPQWASRLYRMLMLLRAPGALPDRCDDASIRTFQFGHLVTTSLTRGEGQCDGRCVQTSGRHSYNLAGPTITTDSRLTVSSSRRRAQHDPRTM